MFTQYTYMWQLTPTHTTMLPLGGTRDQAWYRGWQENTQGTVVLDGCGHQLVWLDSAGYAANISPTPFTLNLDYLHHS